MKLALFPPLTHADRSMLASKLCMYRLLFCIHHDKSLFIHPLYAVSRYMRSIGSTMPEKDNRNHCAPRDSPLFINSKLLGKYVCRPSLVLKNAPVFSSLLMSRPTCHGGSSPLAGARRRRTISNMQSSSRL